MTSAPHRSAPIAVLRTTSAVVVPVIIWAAIGYLSVDLLLRGTPGVIASYLPGLALAAWLTGIVLFAPRLEVGPDALTSHEILRTYRLPYERVVDIRVGGTVTIDYTDAAGRSRRLRPWNAPGVVRLGRTPTRRPATAAPGAASVLVQAWAGYRHDGEPRTATATPNWWQWGVAAALLVLAVVL